MIRIKTYYKTYIVRDTLGGTLSMNELNNSVHVPTNIEYS